MRGGDRVVAVVSKSWFCLAIGKIEIRRRTAREKLMESLPEAAWPMVKSMLDAGLIREKDFWQMWNHRAVEWRGTCLVRNRWNCAFDYLQASFLGSQILALSTLCLLSGQVAFLTVPALLAVFVNNYFVMPHRQASRVLASEINQYLYAAA